MENKKQNTELADIFGRHREDFLRKHNLCPEQAKAYEAIVNCRTSVLGGHTDRCDHCGHIRQSYNSCRNRHCPKCQYIKQVQWVDKLKANLVPVRYFHIVFTIPNCLHKTFYINQHVAYSLMFKAAGEALRICAANPKYLGAQTGAVAVLRTWGQTLTYPSLENTRVNVDTKNKIIYISASNSDGAGGYEVLWIIENNKFKERILTVGF